MAEAPILAPSAVRATGAWTRWMGEISGSLGDLGTFLPLTLSVCVVCGMDFGWVLFWAGALNVLTGWWFRQPIPVQPMKAIAAVAIVQHLSPAEIVSAGWFVGMVMVGLAAIGWIDRIDRWVPREVVRGIQIGVGAKLILTALPWILGSAATFPSGGLPWLGPDSLLLALAAGLLLLFDRPGVPLLLLVFAGGLWLAFTAQPVAPAMFSWNLPQRVLPDAAGFWKGMTQAGIAQVPLTLLNSVVAVCALSEGLFPGRGVPPRRMAMSVGLMNLVSVPLGGLPMCHGAGGLAGQYRFGARTGWSVIGLGTVKILLGLSLGAALIPVLQAYPRGILAVLLIYSGWALGRAGWKSLGTESDARWVPFVTAAGGILGNTLTGFLLGMALWGLSRCLGGAK